MNHYVGLFFLPNILTYAYTFSREIASHVKYCTIKLQCLFLAQEGESNKPFNVSVVQQNYRIALKNSVWKYIIVFNIYKKLAVLI